MQATRTQLYQEIWRDPISKVARKYGVSDTAMRKKCKANNIPIPTNKYWGQLRNDHNPKPDKLVPEKEDKIIQFKHIDEAKVIIQKPLRSENDHLFQSFDQSKRNTLLGIYDSLSVKDELLKPHPLICEHKRVMRQISQAHIYQVVNQHGPCYNTDSFPAIINTYSTTKDCFPRLYLFLDPLFKAIEAAGDKICVRSASDSFFLIGDAEIPFKIKEQYTSTYLPVGERKNQWDKGYRFRPTGLLTMIIYKEYSIYPTSSNEFAFKETPRRKLSSMIKAIFEKIYEISQFQQEEKIKREAQKKKEEEYRKQQEEYEKKLNAKKVIHDAEIRKMNEFISDSQLYLLSQSLRCYISAIESTVNSIPDEERAELFEWIQWAKEKADWLDPACNKDDSILYQGDKHLILSGLSQGQSSAPTYCFSRF